MTDFISARKGYTEVKYHEFEGLPTDCRVGVKESESEDDSSRISGTGSTHGNLLSGLWNESDDRLTR